MVGPTGLHGRLYLVAYDRARRRFRGESPILLEYALRAAVLSDLYLDGHLIDRSGRAQRSTTTPQDPVLRTVFDQISVEHPPRWDDAILQDPKSLAMLVHEDLHAAGWLCRDERRRLGVFPARAVAPADETVCEELVAEARDGLASIIAGRPARPRTLALGLLAHHAQLPATISFTDSVDDRAVLAAATAAAIAPIAALGTAIGNHFDGVRATMGLRA